MQALFIVSSASLPQQKFSWTRRHLPRGQSKAIYSTHEQEHLYAPYNKFNAILQQPPFPKNRLSFPRGSEIVCLNAIYSTHDQELLHAPYCNSKTILQQSPSSKYRLYFPRAHEIVSIHAIYNTHGPEHLHAIYNSFKPG